MKKIIVLKLIKNKPNMSVFYSILVKPLSEVLMLNV